MNSSAPALQPAFPTSGRLLLCRHGQTEFNAGARFQGQIDTELSDLGQRQAELLRERLAREHVDVAYASDLRRARHTAELALAGRDVQLRLEPRLREASFGRWEGLTYNEIKAQYPEDIASRERDRVGFAIPGGESLAQLAVRVKDFLAEHLPRHDGESILLVTHGGTVNAVLSVVLDIPLAAWWRLRNHNANLSAIEFTPTGPRLAHFNDTCHLAGLAELKWP